jgi:MSHA biogenesis protein MshK
MKRLLAAALATAWYLSGQAASFGDPTRPPNALPGGAASVSGGPRLESVLIAPDRRIAVISGQRVQLGDRFGDGHVVQITETEVVIRNGLSTRTLKLYPEVDRQQRPRRENRTTQ